MFHAINGLPGWLYRPMLLAQYLGVLAMPLIVAVGALAFRRWRLAAALVLVVPLKLAAEKVPKLLVERERPGTTVPDAIPAGGAARRAEPCLRPCHHHLRHRGAAGAGAAAPLGGGRLRARHLNAMARVYLGAHNPLDVVGWAAVGLAMAAVLDLVLNVARDCGGSRRGQPAPVEDERAT